MCGIALVRRYDGEPASRVALKRYHKQSARGKEGFGYIPVEDGYIRRVERFTEEKDFLEALSKESATEILLHHRQPTSTENFLGTTHPVSVTDKYFEYDYYLVHNGTLKNHDFLKSQHEKLGLEYTTEYTVSQLIKFKNEEEELTTTERGFLDSEALAKEVALYLEGHNTTIGVRGGVAFVCYQTTKDGEVVAMYYGRNEDRPLIVEEIASKKKKKKAGSYLCIKSEGGGVQAEPDVLYKIDYKTGNLSMFDVEIGDCVVYPRPSTNSPVTPSQTRLLPSGRFDENGLHWEDDTTNDDGYGEYSYDTDRHFTLAMIGYAYTCNLEKRLEIVEKKLEKLTDDRKVYMKMYMESKEDIDRATCQNEINVINEEFDELKREGKNIESELTHRYAKFSFSEPAEQKSLAVIHM